MAWARSELLRDGADRASSIGYEPEVARVLKRRSRRPSAMSVRLLARTIQAQAIWFQMLAIAEQNRDMRRRRELERTRGHDAGAVEPSRMSSQLRRRCGARRRQAGARGACATLRIRPVITAHPTEAKRVTVLERHRRIYLRLFDLESPRWTDREREDLHPRHAATRSSCCGSPVSSSSTSPPSIRKSEPGACTSSSRDTVRRRAAALRPHRGGVCTNSFPGESLELPVVFGFGSWIGGDRDGNPFVTSQRHAQHACGRCAWRA